MLLGSWYKPSELAKRACIFHASSPAASMFSGYLQAGLYKGLNGTHGLAGWRWLFLIDGCMGVPVAIAGVFLLPDLPENCKASYLKPHHIEIGQRRMREVGRAARKKLGWASWKRIFGRWHVYLPTLVYIVFINAVSESPNFYQKHESTVPLSLTNTRNPRPQPAPSALSPSGSPGPAATPSNS